MKSTASAHEFNVSLLMEQLRHHEIKAVHVAFSGCNDSGDVTITRLEPLTPEEEIPEGLLDHLRIPNAQILSEIFEFDSAGNCRPRDWRAKPPTLRELINDICYDKLEIQHAGWELDAGASGTIIFTPLADYHKTQPIVINIEYGTADSEYNYYDEEYNDE